MGACPCCLSFSLWLNHCLSHGCGKYIAEQCSGRKTKQMILEWKKEPERLWKRSSSGKWPPWFVNEILYLSFYYELDFKYTPKAYVFKDCSTTDGAIGRWWNLEEVRNSWRNFGHQGHFPSWGSWYPGFFSLFALCLPLGEQICSTTCSLPW